MRNYPTPSEYSSSLPASPIAVVCLAFFFASSGFGLVLERISGNSLLGNAILLAGPICLWVAKALLRRPVFRSRGYRQVQYGLMFVGCIACLSATAAVFDPALNSGAVRVCLLKTGGLVFLFLALANCALFFSKQEVIYSLILFGLVEFTTMVTAVFLLGVNLNPNAVGVRAATSGLVLLAMLPSRPWSVAGWIGSLFVAFTLQCRTSMLASIGSVSIGFLESRTRASRASLIVMAVLLCSLLAVAGEDMAGALRQTATSNLHSTNPVAKFFLSDKSRQDVSGDFLDRSQVWSVMLIRIKDRPLLGYGIGTESALFRTRSHNAYLSLLIEGGVGLLASWLFVYGIFVAQLSNRTWIARFAGGPIGKLQVLLFAYLVLSAMVESSGIGSISTPNNVVFLFLLLWVAHNMR